MAKSPRHLTHKPRKRFGQNFLQDTHVIEKIVAAVAPQAGEHIVEIGPGKGAITEPLLKQIGEADGKLSVLELDRDLAKGLRLSIGALDNQRLDIIETNALKFDFATFANQSDSIRVVGNLPYNISTPLLFHLMNFSSLIDDMYFMLQKEVVDRITAEPNSKIYGRLSVMMQYYAKTTFLFDVPKGAFHPPPKVTSSVFRLQPYKTKPIQATNEQQLANVVRTAFSQRRKTLRAIFKAYIGAESIQKIGLNPMARPETLSVVDFVRLSDVFRMDA